MNFLFGPSRMKKVPHNRYKKVIFYTVFVFLVGNLVWLNVYQDLKCLLLKCMPIPRPRLLRQNEGDAQSSDIPGVKCRDDFLPIFIEDQNYICITQEGRLGNQMFLFASAYGIAKHSGRQLLIHNTSPLLNMFKVDGAIVVEECVCDDAKVMSAEKHCSFDPKLFAIPNDGNYEVKRYLQSWKYFDNVTSEIREQFAFVTDIVSTSLLILSKLKEKYKQRVLGINDDLRDITFVGVHIREADYTRKEYSQLGFRIAPKEYIQKAMNYFEKTFTNVLFVVVSNFIERAKKNVTERPNVLFMEGSLPEIDMCVLVHCNHTIMTVGTFGWFAAFLAGGVTVFYKHPHKEDSSVRKEYSADYKDYFYPRWIGME